MSSYPVSQTLNKAINISDAGIGTTATGTSASLDQLGDHHYPPQPLPAQAAQEAPNFVDGSGPIFSMYSEMAEEEDKKMAEGWKADADGILIFVSCHRRCCRHQLNSHRPVCSLLLWRRCSRYLSRTFDQTHRTPPTFTSRVSIRPLSTQIVQTFPFLFPHPRSLLRTMQSGSTRFGS